MLQIASQHASTVGTAGSKSSKSMAALNNAVRHATDGFIGILDMFGFEDPKVSSHISVLNFILPQNPYLKLSLFNITCTKCHNIHILYLG
jgi:hypothetical protein